MLKEDKKSINKLKFAKLLSEFGIKAADIKSIEACLNDIPQLIDKLPYWLKLEEKDKPMNPIISSSGDAICPKCHEETIRSTDGYRKQYGRCINANCGQRIDLSVEE